MKVKKSRKKRPTPAKPPKKVEATPFSLGERVFIGIDNGVSGSIGVLRWDRDGFTASMHPTPVVLGQDYTKKNQRVSRLDHVTFKQMLSTYSYYKEVRCVIERPMVNPGRFKATLSAMRCLESTLLILEQLNIGYEYVDSKEWQKVFLPGVKGPAELKRASAQKGAQLYPHLREAIEKQGDADGLLIAEHARRIGT